MKDRNYVSDIKLSNIRGICYCLIALLLPVIFFAAPARAADTNSLTLVQCFDETLAHNDELLRLRKDVERAAGTKIAIRSQDLTHLAGQSELGWRGGSLYGGSGPYALFTAQLSQPLLNTGMAATWRRGECEVLAAEQRFNLEVANKFREARAWYLRAQRLQQLIVINEEMAARLQTNVTSEQQRKDAGSTGPRPVLQAKIQSLAVQGELTNLRRDEFDARLELAKIMDRPPDELPRPTDSLAHEIARPDWTELARVALQKRSDLRFLRELAQISAKDRRAVQAGYFPQISLVGSALYLPGHRLLYQVTPIIEGQSPYATDGRIGVGATWQIIDNGSVTGQSRTLEAVREEYEITLRQLEQDVPRDLSRIGHSLEDADAKLAALNKSVTEADENLRLIESKIGIGEATQLDFSNAQRDLLDVRSGIVEALFQYNVALAELDWTTGRYLEFAEPTAGH